MNNRLGDYANPDGGRYLKKYAHLLEEAQARAAAKKRDDPWGEQANLEAHKAGVERAEKEKEKARNKEKARAARQELDQFYKAAKPKDEV